MDFLTLISHLNKRLRFPRNIRMLAILLPTKMTAQKKPTLVQILPITDLSEQGRPVCEFVLHRKKLLGNKTKCGPFDQSFCSADPEQFMTYMTENVLSLSRDLKIKQHRYLWCTKPCWSAWTVAGPKRALLGYFFRYV